MQGSACNIAHYRSPSMGRQATRCACLAVVPHSSETHNIDRDTESQFDPLVVKQRITPRTTNWYYASCWVVGSHLTDTLTSRRTLQRSLLSCNLLDTASTICPARATTRN